MWRKRRHGVTCVTDSCLPANHDHPPSLLRFSSFLPWPKTQLTLIYTVVRRAFLIRRVWAPYMPFSDIYGDDEDNEYEGGAEDPSIDAQDAEDIIIELSTSSSSIPPKPDDLPQPAHPTLPPDAHRGLPPKPAVAPPASSSLSYSAQVAKQFSVYQQTPSQERQQRKEIPLPPNPRANANARPASEVRPVAPANPGDTVFGKKPSEMHDAG